MSRKRETAETKNDVQSYNRKPTNDSYSSEEKKSPGRGGEEE